MRSPSSAPIYSLGRLNANASGSVDQKTRGTKYRGSLRRPFVGRRPWTNRRSPTTWRPYDHHRSLRLPPQGACRLESSCRLPVLRPRPPDDEGLPSWWRYDPALYIAIPLHPRSWSSLPPLLPLSSRSDTHRWFAPPSPDRCCPPPIGLRTL